MTKQVMPGGLEWVSGTSPREPIGAWVGGTWIRPEGGAGIPVLDPGTENVLYEVLESSEDVVSAAVASAGDAFRGTWRSSLPRERGRLLQCVAREIRQNADVLAEAESVDTGKPLWQAQGDVQAAAAYFDFFGGAADKLSGETIPGPSHELRYSVREPYGVVAQIIPWNSPIAQLSRGVAACLAVGNCAVVKPSELASLTALMLGPLFDWAGIPAGVFNVVPGAGPTVGEALVRDRRTQFVTFTGSVRTGTRVLELAAKRVVPCTMELGGKSPGIVFSDADLSIAVEAAVHSISRNSGQSCSAITRFLVAGTVCEAFCQQLEVAVGKLSVGYGLDNPSLGPLVSAQQLSRAKGYIDQATADGATVSYSKVGLPASGFYMRPVVVTEARASMAIVEDEVFAPVLCVLSFDTVDEALQVANESGYGLVAAVFTRDAGIARRAAWELEAGQVHINGFPAGGVETPFGGYKKSGMGREKGMEALRGYTQLKTVIEVF